MRGMQVSCVSFRTVRRWQHGGKALNEIIVAMKGAGDIASGVAWRLYQANIRRIYMMESPKPMAVRRTVSFCEAVYEKKQNCRRHNCDMISDKAIALGGAVLEAVLRKFNQ